MEPVTLPLLSRIAICGGTHGNELSGVYIVREMLKQKVNKVGSASVTAVISNPRAVERCTRYVEKDLNRCFTEALLSDPLTDSTPYELSRAQELNALLGPKGSQQATDLLCDLHNTTANMGISVISYTMEDWVVMHICKHLQEKITSSPVRLIQLNLSDADAYSQESVGKHGMAIECGPQPHGVLRADVFNWMKEAVNQTLDWVQSFNSGTLFEGGELEAYTFVKSIDYPRDSETHDITAAIHPQLQDADFCLLRPGDPVFLSFSGETITYEEKEPLHPFFVNEHAYYEKKIAFHLGRKITLTIPAIRVKTD